jgi:pimeloyl-ACP methyl ester carboxylesterase
VLLAGAILLLSACAGQEVTVQQPRTAGSPWSKWCIIGNTRVHYLDVDRSNSGCNLLILHGYLGSTVSFSDLIDALSRDLRVVIPDLPGFGATGVPECTCTMEYYLDFLARFTQAVGLERYFLMGTSMGANIAAHYTTEHPEQIEGLIFASPFGLDDQAGRMSQIKRWNAFLPLASVLVTQRTIKRHLRRSILNGELITPELIDAYWRPFTTPEGRRAAVEVTRKIVGSCSMEEVLPQIEQPVLILIGSEDTLLCAGDYERFQLLLARERLEIIEASGHFLYLDSPEVVSQKIVTFTRGGRE